MNALLLLPVLFGASSYLYYRKGKRGPQKGYNNLGMGMLLFVFAFSILALVFYYHPDFSSSVHAGTGKTYISAAIYFFLLYMLWLFPFTKGDFSGYKEITCAPIIKALVTVIAASSLITALLLLPDAVSGYSRIIVDDIANVRDQDIGNIGSGITSIPVLLYSFFGSLLPLAFFYYISVDIKRGELFFIAIATFLTPVLHTFATGSREHFVFPLIETGIAYLLFYRFLSSKAKRNTNIIVGIIGGLIMLVSITMSISRFSGDVERDPSFWIIKYLGEGYVNFNTLMFPDLPDKPTYGAFHMPFFRDLLGLDYVSGDQRTVYWSSRLEFPPNYFYTFLGSIVVDWGLIGAFVFSAFIVFLTCSFTRIKGDVILFSQLIIIHFVACICVKGVFYFTYLSYFGGRTILYVIILCLLLRYIGRT